jgi:hypothetical protein
MSWLWFYYFYGLSIINTRKGYFKWKIIPWSSIKVLTFPRVFVFLLSNLSFLRIGVAHPRNDMMMEVQTMNERPQQPQQPQQSQFANQLSPQSPTGAVQHAAQLQFSYISHQVS